MSRRPWVGLLVVVVLAGSVSTAVWRSSLDDSGLAGEAMVAASTAALGVSARDVVTAGSAESPGAGWQSDDETSGAWIELTWPQTHLLRKIVLVRNPINEPGLTEGFLTFGDGSHLQVRLSQESRVTVVPFSPRSVGSIRFTASAVSAGARNVALAEILVSTNSSDDEVVTDDAPDGNAAARATATMSAGVGASDVHALRDGTGEPGSTGVGADWTVSQPVGAWVQLDWDRPRELSGIQLLGSARSATVVTSATVKFGDGAELPVGAVLADPERPTTLSFMPRIVNSIRITFDAIGGPGQLALAELRAYTRGATPSRRATVAPSVLPVNEGASCPGPPAGPSTKGLAVRCPVSGSVVDGTVDLQVSAGPGYSSVSAMVWPASDAVAAGAPVQATLDPSRETKLPIDVTVSPPGPLTVELTATGPDQAAVTVYFQLHRSGIDSTGDAPSSAPATGRTLTFSEEFNNSVSLSRTGLGADYAGAKPTYYGAQDFGEAIFPKDQEFDNVRVVDNRYLRIDIEPISADQRDPQGWGRTHMGGLLASARQGGSGFSAQYGYFEARMLAPAAPGTWPAFWMLPSEELVAAQPVVAEIDAVELYGHDPKSACHTTHHYVDGKAAEGGLAQCGQRFATERQALSWHTYGVSITPTNIVFYIDGAVVATAPQVDGGGAPMFFLLDLALGGGWPVGLQAVQDRVALYVDYVRVYV